MGQADEHLTRQAKENPPDQVIGSLGDALAGVNINNGSYGYDGNSGSNGQYVTQYPNASGGEASGLSWSTTSLASGFPGANSVPLMGRTASADQNDTFLSGTGLMSVGSYGDLVKLSSEPTTPAAKQSLELFLSQSPSKALGGDLLKLNVGGPLAMNGTENQTLNRSTSAFCLDEMGRAPVSSKFSNGAIALSPGALRPAHDPTIRRKSDSPSCSVTGTSASSRSASPYEGDNRRTIQAFAGTELPGSSSRSFVQKVNNEVNRMDSMPRSYSNQDLQANTMHQVIPADYGTSYSQGMEQIPTNLHVVHQVQQAAPVNTPQVLYMAVPTPDGRGQMLQPVQMVQLQGHPSTFVLPQGSGGAGSSQPAMMVLPSQNIAIGHSNVGDASAGMSWSVPPQYSPRRENSYGLYDGRSPTEDYMDRRNQGQPASQRSASLIHPHAEETIPSLTSATQRPPLDELLGNVRRLSRDQVGCRLLQQTLDEEGPLAATMILNEGLPFWGEAMVDPFGNYLFQKILERITPEERVMLIKNVSARLVNASLNLHGTRSVQKVVEMCAFDEANAKVDSPDGSSADILTRALAPAAARLCIDSHGNHVIQRILQKLEHKHATFVFAAVAAGVGDVARHRHGCCVIQRCLDSPPTEARSHLVHRIVEKSLDLMQDAYGNYVVQYVLDVCEDADVHAVCDSVVGRVSSLAIQKFSSNVMEKCLERCTEGTKEYYLQELSDPHRIRELMVDPFGNYVVQRALSVASHAQAVRLVEAMRPHLISSDPGAPYGQRKDGSMRNTAGGRRIMAKICRRFPNFTLNENATPDELYGTSKSSVRLPRRVSEVRMQQMPVGPPGLNQNQQPHYGSDSQRGRRYVDQNEAHFEASLRGYYDHMRDQASFRL